MRFRDFLRTSVLLFGGAATALAAVSVVGAGRDDDSTLVFVALGWWLLAAVSGLWMGRGAATTPGIARLLTTARRASALPELEPGTILFNRLWPLAVLALAAGALGFFFPPVPAVAVGYAVLVALLWRKQAAAVEAIEGRDGVEFWLDRSSPFGPPALLRLPGMRKIEPEEATELP
ncbi:MAG TPA: hypothetical protein VFQ12_05885 [Thermoleophilaceae bacterium]|nr:hypothetical protein [Thermoleophilaceae bacterium]